MSDLSKMSVEEMDDWIGAASTPDLETDRLSTCYNELARRLASVTAERDRLAEIVAKLPKTANGVPVVPGMDLWGWIERYDGTPGAVHQQNWMTAKAEEIAKCYSTREAAEAAQRGGEVGNG
jgi:hypothetical protein